MGDNFTKKEQIVILLIVVIIVATVGLKTFSSGILKPKDKPFELENGLGKDTFEEDDNNRDVNPEEIINQDIMVHISGQVNKPGLVELKLGQRLKDAVELAGGLRENADLDRINLAKKLADEDKIYIPAIGEGETVDLIAIEGNPNADGKICLNSSDKSQLLSLPGIGEVIAGRIMDYRDKTPFKKIEDLMNVSGIGEKKFQDIKDLVIIK